VFVVNVFCMLIPLIDSNYHEIIKKKSRIHSADSDYGKTDENKVNSTISDLFLEEYVCGFAGLMMMM
jgi:hypothetical protein